MRYRGVFVFDERVDVDGEAAERGGAKLTGQP
jgi:hypothetical protein